jgi:hypothetical protein
MKRTVALMGLVGLLAPLSAAELPRVGQVDLVRLRDNCRRVIAALDAVKAPLPPESVSALRALLEETPGEDAVDVASAIQELLDAQCLIGVAINPESRVKAERGPAAADLVHDQPAYLLLKLNNEAGSTAALKIGGPQVRTSADREAGAWLDAVVYSAAPLGKTLNGNRLEYLVLRLTPHEAGKREATLKFDIGQGTQDLGFRAEVPVLFNVRRPSGK